MAAFHEPSCQGRAVPHTIISGILLLPLLVALPFLTALSSSDRFRLDYRRIYIPILGQATHHFGSHFTGKILLIWPHPAPGEAEKCRLQSEHSWDLSRHLHSTCIRVFPVWLDEFQPLMLHYYYFYYFFTVMFLSWEALSTFDPATRLVVTSHVVIYHCLWLFEGGNYPVVSNYLVRREINSPAVTRGFSSPGGFRILHHVWVAD